MKHEEVEGAIARRSALIYLPISAGGALLFLLAATLGGEPLAARIGGAIWIALLSLVVAMPIAIGRVKKRPRGRAT